MDANLCPVIRYGGLMVAAAIPVLVLVVRRDLMPGLKHGDPGRWFLGAALGMGVIAFAIKLAIAATLANFPERTIAPLLPGPNDLLAVVEPAPPPPVEPPRADRWQPLPETPPSPADNPTTPGKVALGKRLFEDPALSADGRIACATCHDVPSGAGADGKGTAVGITGIPGRRNTPTVFNAAFQTRLFWDGRAVSLERQALGPMLNPDEMGMPSLEAVEHRIAADPSYRADFAQVFGAEVSIARIAQAIAAYERTLITPDSPYDRFVRGDAAALDDSQKRGMWLFDSLGCAACHAGPNFSGASRLGPQVPFAPLFAHRSEPAMRHGLDQDRGRAGPGAAEGLWRIPSLRNVALTAPYFHNGSVADLPEAVRVMATAQLNAVLGGAACDGRGAALWSEDRRRFEAVGRKCLSDADVADIVAFLKALTSERLGRAMIAGDPR